MYAFGHFLRANDLKYFKNSLEHILQTIYLSL